MKYEKATAVILLLALICMGLVTAIVGLEIWDGINSSARIDKVGLASGLKDLLKFNSLQRWNVLLFGFLLFFAGLTVLAWNYQKKLR